MKDQIQVTTDWDTIASLNKSVQELHVKLYPNRFKEYNEKEIRGFFKQMIHNPNYLFLIVMENGVSIGYAWIELLNHPGTPFTKAHQAVYVHQISIIKQHQGKGYGTSLMKKIYEIAISKGIDLIELDYWIGNVEAQDFYKKQGFVKYREFVYKNLRI
ncbi:MULTISPECIES: GNAT family N-acetyltransferase [Bacillaceae]|uniref:GNAT family N-acetyltransferase n=1 Tax=Evansella alkalicola TaxID=745819 RepID=A0ABS6JT00_9BACI|nr:MULTISPECIES: GNAT family N-acetyltransferase [Bacillaceae]MBU9720285.1 GNAT family N-acetyltransferase [Bacillus alkalicola]